MREYYKKINWLFVILASLAAITLTIYYSYHFGETPRKGFFDLIQNVIPDLVAVLIAIPVMYILFTSRGISPQNEFKQDIIEGVGDLIKRQSGFRETDSVNDEFDFINQIKQAKSIDILAISAFNLTTQFRPSLTTAIEEGCNIRIVVIEPDSTAAQLVMVHQANKELKPDLDRAKLRIDQMKKALEHKNIKGSIEMRGINWIPSCSLITVKKKRTEGITRLKVYPILIDIPIINIKTHTIIHKHANSKLFDYFDSHFVEIWKKSKVIAKI